MSKLENIKQDLGSKFNISNYKFTHAYGDDVLELPKEEIIAVLRHFKATQHFDFLMDICGVDYPNRAKRIYYLLPEPSRKKWRQFLFVFMNRCWIQNM